MAEEKPKITDWLEEEAKAIQTKEISNELPPSLKLESGKVYKFKVDFSEKFNFWTSPEGIIKAIIPVEHKGEKKTLWLNKRNPLYREIVTRGLNGQNEFVVSVTGIQKDTKYTLVNED
ncbi:MAG: hypothetical protein NC935_02200 [Candidatus Omnitrophica bacterium]|nr:hypothetical protein [Candidatus Omnitrophota bacterium]